MLQCKHAHCPQTCPCVVFSRYVVLTVCLISSIENVVQLLLPLLLLFGKVGGIFPCQDFVAWVCRCNRHRHGNVDYDTIDSRLIPSCRRRVLMFDNGSLCRVLCQVALFLYTPLGHHSHLFVFFFGVIIDRLSLCTIGYMSS